MRKTVLPDQVAAVPQRVYICCSLLFLRRRLELQIPKHAPTANAVRVLSVGFVLGVFFFACYQYEAALRLFAGGTSSVQGLGPRLVSFFIPGGAPCRTLEKGMRRAASRAVGRTA